LALFTGLVLSYFFSGNIKIDGQEITFGQAGSLLALVSKNATPENLKTFHQGWMLAIYSLFHAVCAIVSFNYALGCLFDERKDRSTLFWRSLPVRDWETVLAKVAMICLIIPAAFLAATMLLQLLSLLLLALIASNSALNVQTYVFGPANISFTWLWQAVSQLITSLWVLPVFAWCLLCSAYSKQRPILFAAVVPMLLVMVAGLVRLNDLIKTAMGSSNPIGAFVKQYFGRAVDAVLPFRGGVKSMMPLSFDGLWSHLYSTPMIVGVFVAVALICTSIWIRRYREDAAL
jgi:ABC-2 type transport system permease protein